MSNGTSPSRLALGSQMHAARPQDATADMWYAVAKQMLDASTEMDWLQMRSPEELAISTEMDWLQQPSEHASLRPTWQVEPWGQAHNLGYNLGGHPAGAHLAVPGGYLGHNLGYNLPPHLAVPGALPNWGGTSHLPFLDVPPEISPPPRPPLTPPPRRPPRREGQGDAPTLPISWSTGRLPVRGRAGDTSRLVL